MTSCYMSPGYCRRQQAGRLPLYVLVRGMVRLRDFMKGGNTMHNIYYALSSTTWCVIRQDPRKESPPAASKSKLTEKTNAMLSGSGLPLTGDQHRRWRQPILPQGLPHLIPAIRLPRECASKLDGSDVVTEILGANPFRDVHQSCRQI